jgi:hypothetical protein
VLSICLERRSRASELSGRRRADGSSTGTCGQHGRPQSRGDGVRCSSCGGGGSWGLGRRGARDKAHGCSGRSASGGDFGGEVYLRDGERSGAVYDSSDGHVGRRRSRSSTGRRCVGWDAGRGSLNAAGGCSGGVVEGVLGTVGDQTRVLGDVLSADTDEVLESLLGLLIGLTPCLDAVDDVLGELGVLAVTVGSGVVLAVLGADLEPGVHASRENTLDVLGRVARRRVAWGGRLGWWWRRR